MAGITATGTTFNLPNFEGPLYELTPSDTPVLSILGGMYGGEGTNTTYYSWQTSDLAAAAQNVALEGAAFPTAEGRVRANVKNVCQIIHRGVEITDTKRGAFGQVDDVDVAHPEVFGTGQGNPITTELDWQVMQSLKGVKRDMEYSIINGAFQDPSTNSTERQTRGLFEAISTNSQDFKSAELPTATGSSSDDVIASTAHGLSDGDKVQFTALTGGTGISLNTTYYVINSATNTFQISTTSGGSAVTFADFSAADVYEVFDITQAQILGLLQDVYDNGGIMEQETASIIVNSWNKRKLSEIFLSNASGTGFRQDSRNVAGVNVETIQTDFGVLNVILDRHVPQDKVLVASLDQCRIMWLERPDLPRLAVEPLARAGLSQRVQISGEFGLMYGNERTHGEILNTSTR